MDNGFQQAGELAGVVQDCLRGLFGFRGVQEGVHPKFDFSEMRMPEVRKLIFQCFARSTLRPSWVPSVGFARLWPSHMEKTNSATCAVMSIAALERCFRADLVQSARKRRALGLKILNIGL